MFEIRQLMLRQTKRLTQWGFLFGCRYAIVSRMNAIRHGIKHHYRPTTFSCGQAALAILLSHYGKELTPQQIVEAVPTIKNEAGEEWGTLNQQLATWCIDQGFSVNFYTADFEVIDLSWAKLPQEALLERMKVVKPERNVPSLGAEFSQKTLQAYIDFVEAGGELHVCQYMQTKLIDELLAKGPILACVNYPVLHGEGRYLNAGPREAMPDDVNGITSNHFVVVYGRDERGQYLIADPLKEPGDFVLKPEHLLCALTAAQVECENTMFVIAPTRTV